MRDVDNIRNLLEFMNADFYKIHPEGTNIEKIKTFFIEPGFKYCVLLRATRYWWLKRWGGIFPFLLHRLFLKHYAYKYGFDISYRTKIGQGLSLSHFGSIIVAAESIGKNCSLRPGVVIGGVVVRSGYPRIGNSVNFGVGSKVIGDIEIGDNVVVGANAVVTKNVPSGAVVAGIPATILRFRQQTK